MIATFHRLPLVAWNLERHIPLCEGWLAESIYQSAQLAGVSQWEEMSAHVAKGIIYYLERNQHPQLISVDDLQILIRRSLQGIGYPDVARQALVVAPRVNIYLPDIARQAPYELLFFQTLKERLDEAIRVVVRGIKLEGLRQCVKMIEHRAHWQARFEALSEQIVAFTRYHLPASSNPIELLVC